MMNINELWKQRFQLFWKEVRTYGKYIFNDHLKFMLIFAISVGAYYYQQWLATLTPSFPTAALLAALFAVILTAGSVQTLLKPADLVFLLPVETQMKPYFAKGLRFTYIISLYMIAIAGAAAAPLYFQQMKPAASSYLLILLLFALAKLWNLFASWEALYMRNDAVVIYDRMLRLGVNFLFAYFLLAKFSFLYTGGVVGVMALYLLLLHGKAKGQSLHWERLIAEEGKKLMLFYRIANLFTDVPALRGRVRRRRWLDWITALLSRERYDAYFYLYIRTLLRSGDYFGLVLRLLIIGGIVVYVLPFVYGRFLVSVFSLYLIGYQLLSLWKHHRSKIWLSLYPIPESYKKKAFLSLILILLGASSFILAIAVGAAAAEWSVFLLTLVLNIVFSYGFTYVYCSKKLEALT